MKTILALLWLTIGCRAALVTIEPDDYPSGTALSGSISGAVLTVVDATNAALVGINVTAKSDSSNHPTGTNVFAAASVGFWNSNQRLKIDFSVPTRSVAILFAGGSASGTEVGELDAFSSTGALLGSYVTAPLGSKVVDDMVFTRVSADIAYVVAYIPQGQGTFGRLDDLRFDGIPEPSSAVMGLIGVATVAAWRRRAIPVIAASAILLPSCTDRQPLASSPKPIVTDDGIANEVARLKLAYPDLADKESLLSKKVREIFDQLEAAGNPIIDLPEIDQMEVIADMAAARMGIKRLP